MTTPTTETKNDGKEFQRFDDLLRKVVSVPKKEIEEREKRASELKTERKVIVKSDR